MDIPYLDSLIQTLAKIPGLGPRSARRVALHLIQHKETKLKNLLEGLKDTYHHIQPCALCHNLDIKSPCHICTSPKRDAHQLCIISDVGDLWAMERTKHYKGIYHVLGGVLSAIEGMGPDQLNTASLMKRMKTGSIQEVIIALTTSLDGQTTTFFLKNMLDKYNVTITTLAQGVPMGGELDYLDEGTLSMAFDGRKKLVA
jgi:recombination protein RecR